MATFGERLSELRNEKELSQDELSTRMNISKSSIGMYERDQREPAFELLDKLALFFEVSTDYLLGRTNRRQSQNSQKAEPEVQFIMRAKEEMSPKAYAKFIKLVEQAKKAFDEEDDD